MFCVFTIGAGIIGVEKNDAFVPWEKLTQRPKEESTKKYVKMFMYSIINFLNIALV